MERQRLHAGNVLLKFDLHHCNENGAAGGDGVVPMGDDTDGCLLSCFPTCQIPRYYAGQMITGHLMIRPVSRIIISGVTLSFGGRCETGWREGCTKWTGKRVFFLERRHLIENRLIPLDCKWHRFDFEYRIPAQLPPSIDEKDGRYTYYGTAIILHPHGADIETHEARFRLYGRLDVDSLPGWLRSSVERKEEMYRSVVGDDASSTRTRQQAASDNDSASVFLQEPEDDILISAGLCLNRRLFVPGDRMVAEGTVTNRTSAPLVCTVRFQQVLAFFADYGLERRGRRSPLYQHYRSNMRLVVRDLVPSSSSSSSKSSSSLSSSSLIIQPGKTRGFACSFDVPKVPPSTQASLAQPITEMSNESRQDVMVFDDRDPLIRYKYFCKLIIVPQSSRPNEMAIPIEVKIGSHRSLKLTMTPASATSRRSSRRSSGAAAGCSSRTDADVALHRSSRDGSSSSSRAAAAAPSFELSVFDVRNEPLNYEDYFREILRSTSSTTTRHRIQEIAS